MALGDTLSRFTPDPSSQTLLVATAVTILVLVWLRRSRKATKNYPPGLRALPVVGSIPFAGLTGVDDHFIYTKLAQKYGSVYQFWLGNIRTIVLNDYDVIREALLDQGLIFAGRPMESLMTSKAINPHTRGVVEGTYSPRWKTIRQTSLAIFKEFGFGGKLMEMHILAELDGLVDHFKGLKGQPYYPKETFAIAVGNIICGVIFGKRYPINDCPELKELIHCIDTIVTESSKLLPLNFVSSMIYLPYFKTAMETYMAAANRQIEMSQKILDEHEKTHKAGDESDFIHAFMDRMGEDYDSEDVLFLLRDFAIGGTETTATTLQWALVYMANNPDIQKRVQVELDEEVGQARSVTLKDETRLHYTRAVLQEIHRMAALIPMALPHRVEKDTTLGGYDLPKGSMVMINLWSVLRDPEIWPDPDTFRPERFLDENGMFAPRPELINFSIGRRSCLGEVLARREAFLFFCGLMQKFTIKTPPGVEKLDEKGVTSLTRAPLPFEVILEAGET